MRIGISFFNSVLGGPRAVTLQILKNVDFNTFRDLEFVIFTDIANELEFLLDFSNVKIVLIKKISKYDLLLWEQIFVWYYAKKEKIDVFHGTKNSIPMLGKFKKICTIHDLAYYIMPDTFSFMQRVHLKVSSFIAKYFSDKIVAVSKNTKKDIFNIIGIHNEKINVIYNGVSDSFFIRPDDFKLKKVSDKYKLPKNFFLHVGTLQPRKNITTILKAFKMFKTLELDEDYYLVLAGRKGWYFKELLIEIEQDEFLKKYVVFTGPIDDEELIPFYYLSYGFVYASNYDGFGLVPLEAMATGTPVVVSNISSLPEVVGDCALLVDPVKYLEIFEAMKKLIYDKKCYEDLVEKATKRARMFSWKTSARSYIELYEDVAKKEGVKR